MKIFRQKYVYNSEQPIENGCTNTKTYICKNLEKKDEKVLYLLLEHLTQPVEIQSDKFTLQPYEFPTIEQPFSVYPWVSCCYDIEKLNENDAMYVLQCLTSSKTKKPIYYLVSPQGIVCSEVQGLLPQRSPDLFNIAIKLLDLEPNLIEVQRSVVSRQGYSICKAIRDGVINPSYFESYGWKDPKKEVAFIDDKFWVFKGRRKQNSPFNNQEYGLAWHSTLGMCRVKFIDTNKDEVDPQIQEDFKAKIRFYEENANSKTMSTLLVHKVAKDNKGIRIFTSTANQGTLQQYVEKKIQLGQKITEYSMQSLLQVFVSMMRQIAQNTYFKGHTTLNFSNVYVHNNRLTLGEPLLITYKKEKKLKDLNKTYDYFAPQLKDKIRIPENVLKLDKEKMDIWSFGFILHFLFTNETPTFDTGKNALPKKSISPGMASLIKKCLNNDPQLRPKWSQISIRNLAKQIDISEYNQQQDQLSLQSRSQEIRLDSPSRQKKLRSKELLKEIKSVDSSRALNITIKEQEAQLIKDEQEDNTKKEKEVEFLLPPEISSKLKRIKLTIKLIIILVMYLVVFFGPFLQNSFQMLLFKDSLQKTPLNLVDSSNNLLSSVTILSSESKFFIYNDISFAQVQEKYHCINDKFDPINNPDYSLYNYVKSMNFTALIYTGWTAAAVICVIKGLTIWRGGISNRPRKPSKRYWAVYVFQQLSIASLLFTHFFIYQFFYFSGISPCFSIQDYNGVEPFFDSSLYLFLSNQNGYMLKVFSTLGVLACFLMISGCFYAWGPKFDFKYFLSVPSILFRFVPYVLFFLLCRIGVFQLFSPTALNDSTKIIASIISTSSKGFFGIVPQVFVIICISIQAVLQLLLYYCQQSASQSDKLSKMFNLSEIKSLKRNMSYGSVGMGRSLNEMSLDNSRQQLDEYN